MELDWYAAGCLSLRTVARDTGCLRMLQFLNHSNPTQHECSKISTALKSPINHLIKRLSEASRTDTKRPSCYHLADTLIKLLQSPSNCTGCPLISYPCLSPSSCHQIWSRRGLHPHHSWRNHWGMSLTSGLRTHIGSGFSVVRKETVRWENYTIHG